MVTDLNGDGIGDILVGHGLQGERGGLTALDGRTGDPLWSFATPDEVFATTPLLDLNGDGVDDPVVGGRTLNRGITALDGRTGSKIWSLDEANPGTDFPETNFNTPVRLPDQDGDQVDDLLVGQSGGQDETRPPARYHLVSGKSGRVLWTKQLPDRFESYAVPSVILENGKVESLIVGSGGETLPGHLFRLEFPSMNERWRFALEGKGLIGSPVVHRFEGTGRKDVVLTAFNGRTYRINGDTGDLVWEEGEEGYETYVSPALAQLHDKPGLDVVTLVSRGTWPIYETESLMKWIDGETGELIHEEKVGIFTSSSPLVADLTGDGIDEVVILSNPVKTRRYDTSWSNVIIFDGRTRERLAEKTYDGLAAATPHLSDLDGDGTLDLIHCRWGVVQRTKVHAAAGARLRWNQFRGPERTGVTGTTR
jgi:hypothetical protein